MWWNQLHLIRVTSIKKIVCTTHQIATINTSVLRKAIKGECIFNFTWFWLKGRCFSINNKGFLSGQMQFKVSYFLFDVRKSKGYIEKKYHIVCKSCKVEHNKRNTNGNLHLKLLWKNTKRIGWQTCKNCDIFFSEDNFGKMLWKPDITVSATYPSIQALSNRGWCWARIQ